MGAGCSSPAGGNQAPILGTTKTYAGTPEPPAGHADDVLFTVPISLPCRVCMYTIETFKLPVDYCMPDFAKGQHLAPSNLKMNPVHSLPFLGAYGAGGEPVGINDSLAIVEYLCAKFPANIPDSFLGGKDFLKKAKILEKVNAIKDTMYRATMYQYVYPMFFNLMSECQYDLCKRDFILQVVEDWCKEGVYLGGLEPTLADFYLVSLHMGNMWNHKPEFKREWKWEEVVPKKYPNMWRTIQRLLTLPAIKNVHETNPSAEICGVQLWNDTVAAMVGAKEMPGKGRMFCYDHPKGMVHPNATAFEAHGQDFDKPVK